MLPHAVAPAPPPPALSSSNPSPTTCKPTLAKPVPLTAAQPTRGFFDAWNSSSTGHQIADNRLAGSTAWCESRNLKLAAQFRAGRDGGEWAVGAGSKRFGRKAQGRWERDSRQRSLIEVFGAKVTKTTKDEAVEKGKLEKWQKEEEEKSEEKSANQQKQIFQGLCFYINGSTAPMISDHKLKHLLVERGAKMSIALGRRSVTHVILGTANEQGGAGGGLAGGKIQKEIARVGGKGVKFVGVEWVVESIKADKRLPETRFAKLKLAPKGQNSVLSTFKSAIKTEERNTSDLRNG